MKKIVAFFFCFVAIVCILNYGSENNFSLRETIQTLSTIEQPPKMPNDKDYDLHFSSYSDTVASAGENGDGIFERIGLFFTWLGSVFGTLWEIISYGWAWVLFALRYLLYIIKLVVLFLGEIIVI